MSRPITPDQADECSDMLSFEGLVDDINDHLQEGGRTYSRSLIHERLISRVMREYEAVGWKVDLVYDHRDGDFLQFSRKG